MESIKKLCVVSCPIATRSGYGSRSRDFVRALLKEKGCLLYTSDAADE